MGEKLATWFKGEIEERGWSLRETARRMGVSHTTAVNIANGRNRPSVKLCRRIAHTFGASPLEIMRMAGLLEPAPADTARLEEVKRLFAELSTEEQDIVLTQMQALVERRRRRVSEPQRA